MAIAIFIEIIFSLLAMHIACVRGAIKRKKLVFLDIVRTSETPSPPPINLDTQNFSVKENFGLSQTPPPFGKKISVFGQNIQKKCEFLDILPNFLLKPFWIG